MCGIGGFLHTHLQPNSGSDNQTRLWRMADRLYHRGPDEAGLYLDHQLGLAHTRLAIVDIRHSKQPFSLSGQQDVLVYNGEIFNFHELTNYLASKHIRLEEESDTELLYRLLQLDGLSILPRIEGQFAFAFYRSTENELWLVRDYFGEKPLFYHTDQQQFIFASEIKAILPTLGTLPGFNGSQFQSIFSYWATTPEQTVFENIHQVPPGGALICKINKHGYNTCLERFTPKALSNLNVQDDEEPSPQRLREAITSACKSRLFGKREVASLVSGGIDSSVITTEICQQLNHKVQTFSVAFPSEEQNAGRDSADCSAFDESIYQNLVVEHLKTQHKSTDVSLDMLVDNLDAAIWHAESPSPRLAFVAMYSLHQQIKKQGVRVVLSGEGADEMLLGYDIFRETIIRTMIQNGAGLDKIGPLLKNVNQFVHQGNANQRMNMMFSNYQQMAKNEGSLASHDQRVNLGRTACGLLSNPIPIKTLNTYWLEALKKQTPNFDELSSLEQAQKLEWATLLSGHLLSTQGDRMSMAHGIETRAPFLDTNLVALLNNSRYRDYVQQENSEKSLLKQAFSTDLPRGITQRTKFPFRAPDAICFQRQTNHSNRSIDYVESLLGDELKHQSIFEPSLVNRFVQKQRMRDSLSPRQNLAMTALVTSLALMRSFRQRGLKEVRSPWVVHSQVQSGLGTRIFLCRNK